jgi:hypothetical protein
MKQKDIALFAMVAVVSAVMSILISNAVISTPKNRQQKVTVVSKISSEFKTPDTKYINTESIDPTKLIQIGTTNNTDPFAGN